MALFDFSGGTNGFLPVEPYATSAGNSNFLDLLKGYLTPFQGGNPLPQQQTAAQPQVAPSLPPPVTIGAPPQIGAPIAAPQPPQLAPEASASLAQAPPSTVPPANAAQSLSSNNPFGGIGAGFAGFVNSGSPLQAIGNLIGGIATGQRTDPMGIALQNQQATANAIYQAMISRGSDPAQAVAVAQGASADPKLAEVLLPQALNLNPPKTIEESIARKLDESGGNPAKLMDVYNKFQTQKAAAQKLGETQGTAQGALPTALAQADQAISLIDSVKKDPNLNSALGAIAGRLPAIGGGQAEVISKIDQLKGQAFLQAWNSLKGAGARITNTEAMRATDAIARLQRVQNPEGFNRALDDLREVIVGVRTRAGEIAGQGPTPPPNVPSFTQDQLRQEAIRRGLIK